MKYLILLLLLAGCASAGSYDHYAYRLDCQSDVPNSSISLGFQTDEDGKVVFKVYQGTCTSSPKVRSLNDGSTK